MLLDSRQIALKRVSNIHKDKSVFFYTTPAHHSISARLLSCVPSLPLATFSDLSPPPLPQTLKGVGGSVVILEEAAYCDLQLINEVVVPLLAMRESVLICISTLTDRANFYTRFLEHKTPNGKPLFNTFQFSLVCEACLKTDFPERCTHRMHTLPRWLDAGRIEVIKTILSEDPAMFLRETMGISMDGTTRAFPEAHIEAFKNRPRIHVSGSQSNVFVAIDPAGGGASAFAICSLIYDRDRKVKASREMRILRFYLLVADITHSQ